MRSAIVITTLLILVGIIPLVQALPTSLTARIAPTGNNEVSGYCNGTTQSPTIQYAYRWNRNGTYYGQGTSSSYSPGVEYAISRAIIQDIQPGEQVWMECQAIDATGSTQFVKSNLYSLTVPTATVSTDYPYQLETYCKTKLAGIIIKNQDGTYKCIAQATTETPTPTSGDIFIELGSNIWPEHPFIGLLAAATALYLIISVLAEKTKSKARGGGGFKKNDDDGWY